eukprot:TRINITY_DN864_c0_g2_i2.p1 TRINITY_DN864_c0_g2~~TRINITY_DN864_c0_g2_i2.p1  ORF type:complete len:762 (+),score=204.34 TRINITY_DN864_c0_g2_i2:124-2409(+)
MSAFTLNEDIFSNEDFNEKQWLSNLLSMHSSDSEQLKLLTVVDSKLQMVHHNCIHSLDFTEKLLTSKLEEATPAIAQALTSVERISELHRRSHETEEVKEAKKVGATLKEMWAIKERIQKLLESLNSIETFEVKAMELNNLLVKGSLDDLIAHIEGMKKSFVVLKSTSGHLLTQKRSFENLKVKLVNFANPLLEQAIRTSDFAKLAKLAKIYIAADSMPFLIDKYAKLEESGFLKTFADRLILEEQPGETKDSYWLKTFAGTLSEHLAARKPMISDILSGSQTEFFAILLNMVYSKTEESILDKFFSEDIEVQPVLYKYCLDKFYEIIGSIGDETSQGVFIAILMRPCKNIITELYKRYSTCLTKELGNVLLQYKDSELKETRKTVIGSIERVKVIYTSYKAIAIHYQMFSFLSSLKKNIEDYLTNFAKELNRKAAELHGDTGIALIDGEADREPQTGFQAFDWKKVQIAVIQFDIVQDLLAALTQLQKFVNEDANVLTKEQEYQAIAYNGYISYLETECGISLYKAEAPKLRIGEELKEGLSQTAKNVVLKCFYSPIFRQVMFVQTNKVWSEEEEADPDLPQFSLTPTEGINSIGEQLLAVVNRLESLNSFIMSSPAKVEQYISLYRKELKVKETIDRGDIDVGMYWLFVLSASICQMLVAKYMQIQALSSKGANQLFADVRYMLNILKAINIDQATCASLNSVMVGLKVEFKDTQDLNDKVMRAMDNNNELKGLNKELIDMSIVKGIMVKKSLNEAKGK